MPLKLTLPADLERRIAGLGDAIRGASDDVAIFVAAGADAHLARLAVARAAARQLGTDAVDVVLLNSAPLSLAGRVLTTRRVLVDRLAARLQITRATVRRADDTERRSARRLHAGRQRR